MKKLLFNFIFFCVFLCKIENVRSPSTSYTASLINHPIDSTYHHSSTMLVDSESKNETARHSNSTKRKFLYRSHLNKVHLEPPQVKKRNKSARQAAHEFIHISKFNIPEGEVMILKNKVLGGGRFGKV